MAQCPSEVRRALPMDRWQIEELFRLDLPVESIPITELDWQLQLPMWQLDGIRFQVAPAAVLADPDAYPHHVARVTAADDSYPIHVIEHHGRLAVLDGFHRLVKAVMRGAAAIDAMRLSRADLAAISRPDSGAA